MYAAMNNAEKGNDGGDRGVVDVYPVPEPLAVGAHDFRHPPPGNDVTLLQLCPVSNCKQ